MHWFDELVAKCVNTEFGRWESFRAPGCYSSVHLVDEDDVLRRLRYTCTNVADRQADAEDVHAPHHRSAGLCPGRDSPPVIDPADQTGAFQPTNEDCKPSM